MHRRANVLSDYGAERAEQLWLHGCQYLGHAVFGRQTTTIKNSGTLVGASPVIDISAGAGGLVATSGNGQEISVQASIDTSIIQTRADYQAGRVLCCGSNSSGSPGRVYTCAMAPTLATYTTGMILNWKPDANGAGGVTSLSVDTLGAISIVKADGVTAPGTTDIVSGELYQLWYDGTVFRLMSGGTGPAGSGRNATPENGGREPGWRQARTGAPHLALNRSNEDYTYSDCLSGLRGLGNY